MPLLLAAAIGCAADSLSTAPASTPRDGGPFDDRLLAAAAEYKGYQRVSDRVRFAPTMCRVPVPPPDPRLFSASTDPTTHGGKLYFLYASDSAAYDRISWNGQPHSPVGQTLVKETWTVEEVTGDRIERDSTPGGDGLPRPAPLTGLIDGSHKPPDAYAIHDGRTFRTGEQRELFIMHKLDPATPGTDQGWVYSVVSADGSRVRAAGMIESCIGCHAKTDRDRLFGHPGSWPDR